MVIFYLYGGMLDVLLSAVGGDGNRQIWFTRGTVNRCYYNITRPTQKEGRTGSA